MPDFTLEPQHVEVVGMTGSGKTTFVNKLLLNVQPACRFIFDDLNRMWPRLRRQPCYNVAQLEASLPTRYSIFEPSKMFRLEKFKQQPGIPTPTHAAFRWWCKWVYEVAARGPGAKIVCVPEVWRWCTADSIPPEFAMLAQAGRDLGIQLLLDTQRPEKVNPSIVGAVTELVCFRLMSPDALKAVRDMGADKERIANLPLGSFVSYDRLTGDEVTGERFEWA